MMKNKGKLREQPLIQEKRVIHALRAPIQEKKAQHTLLVNEHVCCVFFSCRPLS